MKQETYRLSSILSSSSRKDINFKQFQPKRYSFPLGVFSKHCLLSFLHLNTLGHILTPNANSNLDVRNSCDDVTSSVSIMLFCDVIFVFNRWKWIGSKERSNSLALNFFTFIIESSVPFRDVMNAHTRTCCQVLPNGSKNVTPVQEFRNAYRY